MPVRLRELTPHALLLAVVGACPAFACGDSSSNAGPDPATAESTTSTDGGLVGDGAAPDASTSVPPPNGVPRIVDANDDDVVVASFVVTAPPYGADATGASDVTEAFQHALNDAASAGGGVVYAPAGRYRFDGTLVIPEGITLRGDWHRPTEGDRRVTGTVLEIRAGRGAADGTPFVQLSGGAGVEDLAFFYPEQRIDAVTPYPATVQTAGDNPISALSVRQLLAAKNVTFVNSYVGIRFDRYGDPGASIQFPLVQGVYGAPLHLGIRVSNASAFPRVQGVHFAPAYWAESGLGDAPSAAAIAAVVGETATAIQMHGNGSGDVSDVDILDYATGVLYDDPTPGGSNGKLLGARIRGAREGVRVEVVDADVFVVQSEIEASRGAAPVAIAVSPTVGLGTLFVHATQLRSGGAAIANPSAAYGVNVVGSTIEAWSGYAIDSAAAWLQVVGTAFPQANASSGHVHLGGAVTKAAFLADTYGSGALALVNDAPISPSVKTDDVTIPRPPTIDFATLSPRRQPARIGPDSLYLVGSAPYEADRTGATDATAAIQHALDAAGAAGGGTVYLPGGMFRLDGHLTVPAGVELRGTSENQGYTTSARTVLLPYADKGNRAGEPLVTLAAHAGVRGFTVWYPDQTFGADGYIPYPYTVRGSGAGVWVKDLLLANTWDGVDFASAATDDHLVDGLAGLAVDNMLTVGKCSGGIVKNLQTNPTFWTRTGRNSVLDLPGATPPTSDEIDVGTPASLFAQGSALIVGSAIGERVVGAFTHGPETAFRFVAQDGVGGSAVLSSVGAEAMTGLHVSGLGPDGVQIVNGTWHTLDATSDGSPFPGQPYVVVDPGAGARPVRLFSCMNWADADVGLDVRGGTVELVQYQTRLKRGTFARVSGGSLTEIGGRFTKTVPTAFENVAPGTTRVMATLTPRTDNRVSVVGTVDTHLQP